MPQPDCVDPQPHWKLNPADWPVYERLLKGIHRLPVDETNKAKARELVYMMLVEDAPSS